MAFTIGPKRAGTAAGMLLAGLASTQAQALPGGTDAGAISQSTQQIQRDALTPPRVPGAAAGVVSPNSWLSSGASVLSPAMEVNNQ